MKRPTSLPKQKVQPAFGKACMSSYDIEKMEIKTKVMVTLKMVFLSQIKD